MDLSLGGLWQGSVVGGSRDGESECVGGLVEIDVGCGRFMSCEFTKSCLQGL